MKLSKQFISTTALAALFAGTSQAAITVVNGDFQTPTTPVTANNSFAATGIDTISGWTFTGATSGQVNILANGNPAPSANTGKTAGDQYVVFNEGGSATGGTLFQTITGLDINQLYRVSFDVIALFSITNNVIVGGDFSSSSVSLGSGSGQATAVGNGGTTATFTFTATETSGVLTFTDNSSATALIDTGLDNITITAIPEPSSAALLGLASLALLARRRK
ncbi:MAG: PEP-CTERM sorting domain-containing protein [Akkermansiaceae bacterium]|jgi:hypothetical protein|nr:PEP-CTERM sorting domain-containing protein [Akkermansiaceae bacterium]MDP4648135.1 PEP-CTERM sorting domain-containing protein [Akkermansiaceae bacterium]MDP4720990.1 PEP-CTERM sorting domain-containing protein [Akkermansiaceae bacterium]MDP4846863.1 PEP-CTERM sorting domain-containing protein [Akkermansiaceae bacterium]MDP4898246.1 PEP-CTERM sorting domain-containing protein [Akkermansiaceae bacterium]